MKFTLFSASLLCLLQIINAQLSPSYRKLHGAVPVDKKLYIFGGFNDAILSPKNEVNYNKNPDDRFFYLDVSNPFDTSVLPWKAIPKNAKNLPIGSLSSIANGGVSMSIGGDNNTIYFFNNERDITPSPVLSYDSPNNVWYTENFSGDRPIGRNQMRVVTDNVRKIYFLTGFDFVIQGVTRTSGIFVCDTINSNCVVKNAPLSRLGYGATLLPDGKIVYMGGGDRSYVPVQDGFSVIFLYDTINDKWESKITNGGIPPSDVGITTVANLSGNKIVLFGGNNGDNFNLYVLDTTNYEWYRPKVKGKEPVFKRGEHTANVIGKYMVVAFGSNGVVQAKYRASGESDVLLLDISDDSEYVWTTSFDPTPLSNPAENSLTPEPKDKNIGVIIGSVIGSVLLISILSIIGVLLYIRRRKNSKKEKVIPTPGNVTDNNIMSIPDENELSYRKNII